MPAALSATMSAPPCTFLFFLLLLLLGLPALPEAKRPAGEGKPDKPRQAPSSAPPQPAPPAKRGRNRSVPASGELSTKEGHRCTWQTSGEALVSLMVNCSTEETAAAGGQLRYWCRYAGKPELCQAYGLKSSQYWKQLVGKLKKRQNACEGEKVLKAKTCKKAPAEAHMKLARRGGGGGQQQDQEEDEGKRAAKKKTERKKKKGEEEEKKKREERTEEGDEEEGELLQSDMEPLQSYCSEGWHSVCSFFLKFFEG